MATVYITEFTDIGGYSAGGSAQIASLPAVTSQTVAIGGSSTASSAFNAATRYIRLNADAACSIAFGTSPTASATTLRLAPNQTEYFAVPNNAAYKVAVITNS